MAGELRLVRPTRGRRGVETMAITDARRSAANDNFSGFYVYVWRRPNGEPFYVGKGTGKRAYSTNKRSKEFKEVYALGGCTVDIVDWFIHESQAHAFEIDLIERFGRRQFGGILVNKTDGGEGAVGSVRSKETRARISKALRGRTFDAEWRTKISVANCGRVTSIEHRVKLSEAGLGRILTAEERSKVAFAARGRAPKAGFKGVTTVGVGRWRARIKVDGRLRYLGYFTAPEEAARAYDAAVDRFWGPGPWYRNFSDLSAASA